MLIVELKCLLKLRLKEKGWEQTDLAIATGIHKQQINRYANDEAVMSLKTMYIVAYALGVRIDQLYEVILTKVGTP